MNLKEARKAYKERQKRIKRHLQTLDKDKIIELYLQKDFECKCFQNGYEDVRPSLQQLDKKEQEIRKQVCDEIKGQILAHIEVSSEEWIWQSDNYVGLSLLKQILDQIEKGEQ